MFQNFDETTDHSQSAGRVARLRADLAAAGLDGCIVPRADEHQGEYIPASAARLEWLTGFSGSAGVAVVLAERAAILTDGRYTLQVRSQVDLDVFETVSSVETSLTEFLKQAAAGKRIGYDPWLHTVGEVRRLSEALAAEGGELVAMRGNPIDRIWNDRPAPPKGRAVLHEERHAGRPATEKLGLLAGKIAEAKADIAVLTDPASIAWAFNIRGSDVPHTPLMLSFAILRKDGRPTLFVDPDKLDAEVRAHLEALAELAEPEDLEPRLTREAKDRAVGLDMQLAAARLSDIVTGAGGRVVEMADPAKLPRAIKNPGEIAGSRAAHLRDGVAVTAFLAWLDRQAPGSLTEIAAAEKLEAFRAEYGEQDGQKLRDISFDTIAGSGPNGAIVHYRVNRESDRALGEGELFLLDSGAQYRDGTTDITRTMPIGAPSAEMREKFTLVLKGMIAISTARFPKGTRGVDLDPLARIALWKAGCDYAHGTGHGVGSYLAVHEGPQSISKRGMAPLEPGMILSNEPGYYREGAFGIRIENLILVTEAEAIPGGDIAMLGFTTLTLAPIDRRLVAVELMSADEIAWLDAYHRHVREALTPLLDDADKAWLDQATRPLATS
ncbi:aminopeptidase P family protein [Aurantimonas sp. VKM B-3413]|uniref:aminopeptidase P family protein n=1 Tax=Aurantimonas sp. VKM B-3413 TaxID=2779401 RepID=UPI001E4D9B9E|nr:aminopeptidase P family protein [Aurantimonas sp. VKM B-3413]MCB8837908.1 aminopeptidase P family protein [Aurantimonas sp. VKM B-3413]